MKIAYIYDNGQIKVEFPPDVFRKLLQKYQKKYKNIDEAIDAIERDLKREILKT